MEPVNGDDARLDSAQGRRGDEGDMEDQGKHALPPHGLWAVFGSYLNGGIYAGTVSTSPWCAEGVVIPRRFKLTGKGEEAGRKFLPHHVNCF